MRRRQRAEEIRLLERYRDLVQLLSQVNEQLSELVLEQQQLLQEQREFSANFVGAAGLNFPGSTWIPGIWSCQGELKPLVGKG